jgi:hypothetical protein
VGVSEKVPYTGTHKNIGDKDINIDDGNIKISEIKMGV